MADEVSLLPIAPPGRAKKSHPAFTIHFPATPFLFLRPNYALGDKGRCFTSIAQGFPTSGDRESYRYTDDSTLFLNVADKMDRDV